MLEKGLVKINWDNIKNYSDEEVSYFLFLEGKSIETIAVIRGYTKEKIQKQILEGKIKYGLLTKCSNEKELFEKILNVGKFDKTNILNSIDSYNKKKLLEYIANSYNQMNLKTKEGAIWIIGECKDKEYTEILMKASVNNSVTLRRLSVSALGKLQDTKAENALKRALNDDNPQVVLYALKAIQKLNYANAYDRILEIYKTAEKEYLKRAAGEILGYTKGELR